MWLTGDEAAGDSTTVDQGLDTFNRALPALAQVQPMCCSVRLASGRCVGGALARTWGAACELQQLWVDEPWRGRRLGSRLVAQVEAEARTRGCVSVYLDTFSFQAPGFYRRLGYVTALTIEGFPEGITKFLMTKRLA
jgi:ribosomal protein S18 acetylase RimI-like enzyme